ncbi:diguanylate cyclase [Thalassotalea euphylliae]|uniref:tetratricopeptide repeat-containing diguanylate cyclase n=1 Tax=Thalassotalea euphylliae TaxID=1655234 RepID=UPI0036421831
MFRVVALVCVLMLSITAKATGFVELERQANGIEKAPEKLSFLLSQQSQIQQFSPLEQVKFWHLLGMTQDQASKVDAAYDSFTRAIALFNQYKLPLSVELPLAYIERSYMQYLKTFDPVDYCGDRTEALRLIRQLPHESELLIKILVQNAFCFRSEPEQLRRGLALLDEAVDIATRDNVDKNLYSMIYNASTDLYLNNQLFDKAYEFAEKAYNNWATIDDYADMFNMQHTMVTISLQLMDVERAQQHVDNLFNMAEAHVEFKDFAFFAYFNRAKVAFDQGKYKEAQAAYLETLARKGSTSETYFVRYSYERLVHAFFILGQHEQAKSWFEIYQEAFPESDFIHKSALAIKQFYAGSVDASFVTLLTTLDSQKNRYRYFIRTSNEAAMLVNSQNLLALDNQVLQQALEINRLMLSEQKSQNQVIYLTLSLVIAVLAGALLFISYLVKTRRAFRHRAQTDYLTGIANRRYCFEIGEQLMAEQGNQDSPISAILFDIDHFKKVNDTLGHDAGDNALKMVVEKTKQTLRKFDVFGRIGGEEFLVLLPNTSKQQAMEIADRINKNVATLTLNQGNISMPLSMSAGVVECALDENLDQAIARADSALYQAKSAGRNRVIQA